MSDFAIHVNNVSKKYCKRLRYSILYGMQDIAKKTLSINYNSEKLRRNEFWALNDISFELKRGETLGIIGHNGAGKTTILKLLNGIIMPDKGRIDINGRTGALIEIGAGFHPLLTGRENIYINGAILGMSRKEINSKFDSIVDFADIGDFLDTPVKNYSSGMFVRLGFAIAVHCEPEILLVDEVLAVGDQQFQRRCINKLNNLQKSGMAIVFVSHALTTVEGISSRVIWMDKGKVKMEGLPAKVIEGYLYHLVGTYQTKSSKPVRKWGTYEA
ncbi:MAG: ABC transporter ATP-binding protein, partial [Elusimicrobiota bacterium]